MLFFFALEVLLVAQQWASSRTCLSISDVQLAVLKTMTTCYPLLCDPENPLPPIAANALHSLVNHQGPTHPKATDCFRADTCGL